MGDGPMMEMEMMELTKSCIVPGASGELQAFGSSSQARTALWGRPRPTNPAISLRLARDLSPALQRVHG